MISQYLAFYLRTQTRGRTGMDVTPLVFETSASTDSAIWATRFSFASAKVGNRIEIPKFSARKKTGHPVKQAEGASQHSIIVSGRTLLFFTELTAYMDFSLLPVGNHPYLLHTPGIPNLLEYLRMPFRERCHLRDLQLQGRKPNHILCKCTSSYSTMFKSL